MHGKTDYDAVVVGARCAGAATAMLLARGGMRVLLVDWDEPGTDTMSTHALMRGATMQLARWGLLETLLAAGTPLVTKTTFHYNDLAFPVEIRPSFGTPGLVAPRRYLLDATLVAAARAAGVDVRFRTAFREIVRGPEGRVGGAVLSDPAGQLRTVTARLVIGADGRRSTFARRVGSRVVRNARNTIACAYAYYDGLADDGYRWYYAPGLSAGAIPTNDARHCVFVAAAPERLRAELRDRGASAALATLASETNRDLGQELACSQPVSTPVIFSGAPGFLREAAGPGWALVGDAGYFKDPLTAHGITDALRDAELLARAALSGSDAAIMSYQQTRDALSLDMLEITDRIAGLTWSMEQLMADHVHLNQIMKHEQRFMAESFADVALAA